MSLTKFHYVFSFLFIFITCLSAPLLAQKKGKIQKGSATWYGDQYHGRKTTSGEVYNKNRMTAAHPTLPFGTTVKVTNLTNHHSVIVRITDRGPFGKRGHIIDLSEAAAKKIGIYNAGFRDVTVETLSKNEKVTGWEANAKIKPVVTGDSANATTFINAPYFIIQAGSFAAQTNAETQIAKIKALEASLPLMHQQKTINGKNICRVVAGHFVNRAEAELIKSRLEKKGVPVLVKQIPAAA